MTLLALRAVCKSYGSRRVLDHIDLDVDDQQCVALVGASGSGKSTLLRVIDLLEEIDDGHVFLDGQDIADPWVDANTIRARMGMVFQAYNLFPHLSVLDNLTLAPRRVHGHSPADAREMAVAMLDQVGLAHRAGEYPERLSGGERQRVAIARALVTSPQVLLLDEVTSALDPELTGEVVDLLVSLREAGHTMVIATHEFSLARHIADEVCFLHDGRVHERGTPAQVLGDPLTPQARRFLGRDGRG